MLSFDALERAFESARVQSNKYNGRTANEKGQRAEVRCLNAVKEVIADCPWAYSARLASQKEDSSGIDIVIDSVLGKLYLQVKSYRYGAFR